MMAKLYTHIERDSFGRKNAIKISVYDSFTLMAHS